jgi:hypothetical protein
MATYKGVKGFTVQTLSADPPAPVLGQIWYNSTSNVLKGYVTTTAAWAAGNTLNQSKRGVAGIGSQTAALCAGGNGPGLVTVNVEEYNGTSWAEITNMGQARYVGLNAGTATAGLTGGGVDGTQPPGLTAVEEYNGTSWSEVTDLGTARYKFLQGVGTQTAALAVGGRTPAGVTDIVDDYNGASWTSNPTLNSGRQEAGASGSTTAALAVGGMPGNVGIVEEFNGTSWAEETDLTTARGLGGSCFQASNTNTIYFGGNPHRTITEEWNGTSWTETADMATPTQLPGGAGNATAGLSIGGEPPAGFTDETEEWSGGGDNIVTLTSS